MIKISNYTEALITKFQKQEIEGYLIYTFMAGIQKSERNKSLLNHIANDELKHYEILRKYSQKDIKPNKIIVLFYKFGAILLGSTFTIKILENNEIEAQHSYSQLRNIPEINKIIYDEERHETELISMIQEERLNYISSVVLGLNDALVELSGALAGLTLALRNSELIVLTGSVTGIAAAMSMAVSEYLSVKSEGELKVPLKASFYTGIAYLFTVIILIFPFLVLSNIFLSLGFTLIGSILIIAAFNYYYAVVKDVSFKKRFSEMALLSFGIAFLSFVIGFILRKFTDIK